MQCSQCGQDVPPHLVLCAYCESFLGYPNVRGAEDPSEKAVLDQRYRLAHDNARGRGCEQALGSFEGAVRASEAVICRRWGTITKITEHDNDLFKTYYEQLADGDRLPDDSYFDRARLAVDATFFPYYYEKTNFAILSLDGCGPASYGECRFVFHDASISHRTSVFEENTLVFCEKHPVPVGRQPPKGYRAVWDDRHRLAAAKLYQEINDQTQSGDFAGVLIKQRGATNIDEFIETHIYGKLDLTAVRLFIAPKPRAKDDLVLARRAKRKLREAGAKIQNIS